MPKIDQVYKAVKFLQWYKDPPSFFNDAMGYPPYEYQAEVMNWLKRINSPVEHERLKRLLLEAAGGTGKSILLSCIALWLTVVLPRFINRPYSVLIISGSEDQAKSLYAHSKRAIEDNPIIASEVEGDPLTSRVYFKDRSVILAVPNSEKAIQGKHTDCVIVDEGAIAGDFVINDTFRIIGHSNMDLIILSGTPMVFGSKFVEIAENKEKYTGWERKAWDAMDCPNTRNKWEEAKRSLPDDMFTIFWEGKAYSGLGVLIDPKLLKDAVKDVPQFTVEDDTQVIAGIDWGYCLSGDTEVLTLNGWKRLDKVSKNEKVLCLNQNNMESEYQQITAINVSNYKGLMTHIKNRNLDILCKTRHLIPYKNRYKNNLHMHYAGEHVTHHYIIRKAKYNGIKSDNIKIGNKKYNTKLFMRLLGWYISEGNIDTKTRFCIHQDPIANNIYFNEIIEIGNLMNIHTWYDNNGRILFYDKNLVNYFSKLGKSKDKYIPQEIKLYDGYYLSFLFDSLIKGDGDKYFIRYNTYSSRLAEDVQEIACKTGKYHSYISNRGIKGYRVNFLSRDSIPSKEHYRNIEYNGTIVGFNVPSEIVFTRRNGKVSYQHNQHYTAIVLVQRCKDNVYRVIFVDAWRREEYKDMQQKIIQILRDFNVIYVYADHENISENQRLEDKGVVVNTIVFNKYKVRMQSHLKTIFHQKRIAIPEVYHNLATELRRYNWTTKQNDDRVDALQLACWGAREEEAQTYDWEIF